LERIGGEEALKPVPPAYGMYRGSVRIGDHDIRYGYPLKFMREEVIASVKFNKKIYPVL
jgi:hypothetical protein